MVTNVVRSKFMKVVSRVGCKHLQGSISNVTISKQDHNIHLWVGSGLGKNQIRADPKFGQDVREIKNRVTENRTQSQFLLSQSSPIPWRSFRASFEPTQKIQNLRCSGVFTVLGQKPLSADTLVEPRCGRTNSLLMLRPKSKL